MVDQEPGLYVRAKPPNGRMSNQEYRITKGMHFLAFDIGHSWFDILPFETNRLNIGRDFNNRRVTCNAKILLGADVSHVVSKHRIV